ncbi:hypothetical protein H8356DRAFT_1431954 [Neocallimastix lanati (nom. inval.)]|nr:hypothetical protein H8356DRAFT_1431954 [Neocallimastix sp. JGI-2020a]
MMAFIPLLKLILKNVKGYSNSNDRKSNYNKVKKIKKIKRKIKSFDGVMHLTSVFKLRALLLFFGYNSIFLCANSKIPGIRGLYIGVHNSCSYTAEKCQLQLHYITRLNAFSEMEKWLSKGKKEEKHKENSPAVLLGDSNIILSKNFLDWTVANLTGSSIIYSKGSKSSHLSSACSFANDISDRSVFRSDTISKCVLMKSNRTTTALFLAISVRHQPS